MSLTVGFANPGAVTIGGKTAATINTLNDAGKDASAEALGVEKDKGNQVRTGGAAPEESKAEGTSNLNTTVKMLLKRMQELQKQLQEQQQQLAAAQAKSYPTPEAKSQVVMSIQGQIAQTSAAMTEVAAALVKEMSQGSTSGNVVNTTV
jgi:dsDNA-specific endonuclease/ATPase MutS2